MPLAQCPKCKHSFNWKMETWEVVDKIGWVICFVVMGVYGGIGIQRAYTNHWLVMGGLLGGILAGIYAFVFAILPDFVNCPVCKERFIP